MWPILVRALGAGQARHHRVCNRQRIAGEMFVVDQTSPDNGVARPAGLARSQVRLIGLAVLGVLLLAITGYAVAPELYAEIPDAQATPRQRLGMPPERPRLPLPERASWPPWRGLGRW